MKKLSVTLLFSVLSLISLHAFSQEKTGQICFIRATGYVGSAVNFKVFLDDSLICKLKNKTYSIHEVRPGKHIVAAQNTGLSSNKRSEPFEIEVKEGAITYIDVIWANKVSTEEITANSADVKLKKLKQTTKCE